MLQLLILLVFGSNEAFLTGLQMYDYQHKQAIFVINQVTAERREIWSEKNSYVNRLKESPNKELLAFVCIRPPSMYDSSSQGRSLVKVIDKNGHHKNEIPNAYGPFSWSPEATRIAYVKAVWEPGIAGRLNISGLSIFHIDNSEEDQIPESAADVYWSPKSGDIFFVSTDFARIKKYSTLKKEIVDTDLPGILFSPDETYCANNIQSELESTCPRKIFAIDKATSGHYKLIVSTKKGQVVDVPRWLNDCFVAFDINDVKNSDKLCLLNCTTLELFVSREKIVTVGSQPDTFIVSTGGSGYAVRALSDFTKVRVEDYLDVPPP